ncbi:ankyrin repeat domain-containing protein SOWAHA-like [Tigriopus californicus]|uniref:ankyrin repeat domain-containing protein SOWAHA-like n=1 Tax=Tigriopus californicus TaxID=6832 RepID=UPI0027D9E8DE|nr:ankyrin repeat domain-containing protein SOWAHA-like [Tigriopus californicus]
MSGPTEFTLESVRQYMLAQDGRVTNHELVKYFKAWLTHPSEKEQARQKFKEYVNTLATIKQEQGEKYLVLKRKFYPHFEDDEDLPPAPPPPPPLSQPPRQVSESPSLLDEVMAGYQTMSSQNVTHYANPTRRVLPPTPSSASALPYRPPPLVPPPSDYGLPTPPDLGLPISGHIQSHYYNPQSQRSSYASSSSGGQAQSRSSYAHNGHGSPQMGDMPRVPPPYRPPPVSSNYRSPPLPPPSSVIRQMAPPPSDYGLPVGSSSSHYATTRSNGFQSHYQTSPPIPLSGGMIAGRGPSSLVMDFQPSGDPHAPPIPRRNGHPEGISRQSSTSSVHPEGISRQSSTSSMQRAPPPPPPKVKEDTPPPPPPLPSRSLPPPQSSVPSSHASSRRSSQSSVTTTSNGNFSRQTSSSEDKENSSPDDGGHAMEVSGSLGAKSMPNLASEGGSGIPSLGPSGPQEKISVKERTKTFNRMASEIDLNGQAGHYPIRKSSSSSIGNAVKRRNSRAAEQISSRRSSSTHRDDRSDDSASITTIDQNSKTWMVRSAQGEFHAMMKLLREDPRLAKHRDFTSGFTALHWAAKHGDLDMVKLLAGNYKVNPNAKSNGGYTPLHLACQFGHQEVFDILIKSFEGDPKIRDNSGKTPRQYMMANEQTMGLSLSNDTFRQLKDRRRNRRQAAEKNPGILKFGSLSVKVKKTTEAFNNYFTSKGENGVHGGDSDGMKMPPPKFGPIKKRKSKRSIDYGKPQPVISGPTPIADASPMKSIVVEEEAVEPIAKSDDSDSEYGFDSQWTAPT